MVWHNHHHYVVQKVLITLNVNPIYSKQSLLITLPSSVPGKHSFIFFGYRVAFYGNFAQIENVILTSNLDSSLDSRTLSLLEEIAVVWIVLY